MATAPVERKITGPKFPPARVATPEEGFAMLDRCARRYLGIDGDEFLRRWARGDYAEDPDQDGVMEVAALLPFVQDRLRQVRRAQNADRG